MEWEILIRSMINHIPYVMLFLKGGRSVAVHTEVMLIKENPRLVLQL